MQGNDKFQEEKEKTPHSPHVRAPLPHEAVTAQAEEHAAASSQRRGNTSSVETKALALSLGSISK